MIAGAGHAAGTHSVFEPRPVWFLLSRALAAASRDRDDERARLARDTAALASGDLSGHAAVVVLSTRGLERQARDAIGAFVRSGGGVLVAASPEIEPGVLGAMFDLKTPIGRYRGEHRCWTAGGDRPAASDLPSVGPLSANLGQVRFERTWRIRPEGWDIAARFSDGTPALLERAEGRGRIVLFASDFDRRWNDFPVQPSFVPFVVEAVRYVSGARPPSDYLVAGAPEGVARPPGIFRNPKDSQVVAVQCAIPAKVNRRDWRRRTFATAHPGEPTPSTGMSARRARQVEARQSYWQYGLLLMIGALVAESVVGRA